VQRLQVQLKNGHSGFADFKGLKQAEIEALKQEIFDLKNAVRIFFVSKHSFFIVIQN